MASEGTEQALAEVAPSQAMVEEGEMQVEEEEDEASERGEAELQNEDITQPHPSQAQAQSQPKPKARSAPQVVVREIGKTLLPLARVQRIMKADKVRLTSQWDVCLMVSSNSPSARKRPLYSSQSQPYVASVAHSGQLF